MGMLYEKDVTLQLTLHVQINDRPLTEQSTGIAPENLADRKRQQDEQSRLLQALLQQKQTEFPQVLLVSIAWFLDTVNDDDWEQILLGHLGISDPSFCRGNLFSSTIATLSEDDQELWKESIATDDPTYGNLFHLCTEDMDRCFQIHLKHASLARDV